MHGKRHVVPDLGLPFPGFVLTGIVSGTLFHPFVTVTFPYEGRLDGRTQRFARIIRQDIDNAVIGSTLKLSLHLPRLNIEAGKQRAVFPERLETVGGENALDDIGHLPFHVTAPVVRFLEVRLQQFLPFVFHLFHPELLLQFAAGLHRTVPFIGVVYLFSPLVHAGGDDMDVPAADVLMHIYNVGLVTVSHLPHILLCQLRELSVREQVFQRRVQRDVEHGLLRVPVGKQIVLKRPHRLPQGLFPVAGDIGYHAVSVNDAGGGFIHLLLVVGDSPVERDTPADFRHHVIPPPFSVLSGRRLQTHGSA